jgi:hypothetical protein
MKNASNTFDAINDRMVKLVLEHASVDRIHTINSNGCSIEKLRRKRNMWHDDGSIVIFTAGVFDILHVNHLLALTHYRLLGAQEYLVRQGSMETNMEDLREIAASDKVRFILSVDSDARVSEDKAFIPSKGDCPKPLVSWRNRVLLLARQQISRSDGSARPLVDFITMHGKDSCTCDSCPHQDNVYIASAIRPDLVIVSSGSPSTIQKLEERAELADSKLIVIREDRLAYHDALLRGPIKSSSIIRRAQSR